MYIVPIYNYIIFLCARLECKFCSWNCEEYVFSIQFQKFGKLIDLVITFDIHHSQHNQTSLYADQTNKVISYGHPELPREEKIKFEPKEKNFSFLLKN